MTPTSRTLKYYRDQGYLIEVVERWIEKAGIWNDLFSIIDCVAIQLDGPIIGVQSTVASCMPARICKAKNVPALRTWLSTGARFVVIGWGKREGRWVPRVEEIGLDECGGIEVEIIERPKRKRPKSRWKEAELF